MIADTNKLKGKYTLGIVVATNVGSDGLVCSATVQYFIRRGVGETCSATQVIWSIQRLVLILPVEEQAEYLLVRDDGGHVQVCKVSWKRGVRIESYRVHDPLLTLNILLAPLDQIEPCQTSHNNSLVAHCLYYYHPSVSESVSIHWTTIFQWNWYPE